MLPGLKTDATKAGFQSAIQADPLGTLDAMKANPKLFSDGITPQVRGNFLKQAAAARSGSVLAMAAMPRLSGHHVVT
jgi:hypothetical protein